MSTHILPLDCDGFAARLGEYLERDLSEGARAAMDAHVATCAECAALLDDLTAIRQEAAAMPTLAPSRDLWGGIAERLDESVVVPMDGARRMRAVPRRWARPAVAAAALVVVTAGVTHLLTRTLMAPRAAQTVAVREAEPAAVNPAAPRGVDGELVSTNPEPAAASQSGPASGGGLVRSVANRTSNAESVAEQSNGRTGGARGTSALPLMGAAEPVYDQEITKLRRIVRQRRSQLDPATVAVLEQSIAVIDSAIAQSRAALAKDPASGFLATQLNHSLEKKVELLRTAATLPSRT